MRTSLEPQAGHPTDVERQTRLGGQTGLGGQTRLILRLRLRALGRWIRAYGFELFFLGPMILGGALWVLQRQLDLLRAPILRFLDHPPLPYDLPLPVMVALALLLFVLPLPATLRELYGRRGGGGALDPLPVPVTTRFHVALAAEVPSIIPTLLALLAAIHVITERPWLSLGLVETGWRLLSALATLALLRIALALAVARSRRGMLSAVTSRWLAPLLLVAPLLALALSIAQPLASFCFLLWLPAAAQIEIAVRASQSVSSGGIWTSPATQLVLLVGLYAITRMLFTRWHRRNLEVARQLVAPNRSRGGQWQRKLLLRWIASRPIAAQLIRDLTLVARRFSPAVPLSAMLMLTAQFVAASWLHDASLPMLWRERLAVLVLTFSVLSLVALVPFLLKHQLPCFWLEKTTGVELELVWKTKLWTAAVLGCLPLGIGALVLLSPPELALASKGSMILQLIATTWIVTSVLGLAVFEIAAQPALGLVFSSLVALALAALIIFYPQGWWLWLAFHGYAAGQIAGRASRRVKLLEIEP
ncbi:MAG: hypothetical protein AAF560_05345 [Acidobacteriota bacterium]